MSLSKEFHPNGVRRTRKVPRSEAGFRRASENVAAIDFGTTFCSLAYTLKGTKEILKLPLDGPLTRVPNAILIEKESNTVRAIGYRARHHFCQLRKQAEKYAYFERMKMILYRTGVSLFSLLYVYDRIPMTRLTVWAKLTKEERASYSRGTLLLTICELSSTPRCTL